MNPRLSGGSNDDSEVIEAVPASEVVSSFPRLREPLIEGLLRVTETANMIDAAKGGKTHTAVDLALSVATGRAWLGKFSVVSPGAVLYVDAELHPATMARRIAAICAARGLFLKDVAGRLDVLSLRGRLRNVFQLASWFSANAGGKYRLIVLDALYRMIPEGLDENSNSDMTRVFNVVDRIAEQTGAAVLIVHHSSKGGQGTKSVVDVGSGASAMARATDTHLIFRKHAEEGCKVLEMAGRSWAPLAPVVLRWKYPVWDIDESLDPTDVHEGGRRRKSAVEKVKVEPWTADRFLETFTGEVAKPRGLVVATARQAGVPSRTIDDLLRLSIASGSIRESRVKGSKDVMLARGMAENFPAGK